MRTVGQVRRGKWPIMALADSIAIFDSIQSWIRQESGWPRSLQAMCKCRFSSGCAWNASLLLLPPLQVAELPV